MTRRIPWAMMAGILVAAAALAYLGGVASAFEFDGVSGRFRLEQLAGNGASIVTALVLLAAALALMYGLGTHPAPSSLRGLFLVTFVVAAMVMFTTLASAVSVAFTEPGSASTPAAFATLRGDWNQRLAVILPRVASGIIAFLAAYFANRYAPARDQPSAA